jgi:hypothetical protein
MMTNLKITSLIYFSSTRKIARAFSGYIVKCHHGSENWQTEKIVCHFTSTSTQRLVDDFNCRGNMNARDLSLHLSDISDKG